SWPGNQSSSHDRRTIAPWAWRARLRDSGAVTPGYDSAVLAVTHRPQSGAGGGAAAVTARDWSRYTSPPAIAHSTSCGQPNAADDSRTSAVTRRAASAVSGPSP